MQIPMSAEQYQQARYERELDERNRPLTDEELDAIMPPTGATRRRYRACCCCERGCLGQSLGGKGPGAGLMTVW